LASRALEKKAASTSTCADLVGEGPAEDEGVGSEKYGLIWVSIIETKIQNASSSGARSSS